MAPRTAPGARLPTALCQTFLFPTRLTRRALDVHLPCPLFQIQAKRKPPPESFCSAESCPCFRTLAHSDLRCLHFDRSSLLRKPFDHLLQASGACFSPRNASRLLVAG